MADLLDEVKQDLKEEQFAKLFKRLIPYCLGAMAAVIVGVSAKLWWIDYQNDKIFQAGADYQIAILKMRAMKIDDAQTKLKALSDTDSTVYSSIAKLNLAAFKDFKGEHVDAAHLYKTVGKQASGKVFGDLSKYLGIKSEVNNGSGVEQQAKLAEYVDSNSMFSSSASDLSISIDLSTGSKEKAVEKINALLSDSSIPITIAERAKVIKSYIN